MKIEYRWLLPQRLRRRLRSMVVECGVAGCRGFHLSHSMLPRLPGIFLDQTWCCSPSCFGDSVKQRVEAQLGQAMTDLRHPPRMPFRLILLSSGKVTQEQLAEARRAGGARDHDLGDALVRLGHATEQTVAAGRAAEAACLFFSGALQAVPAEYSLPLSLMRAHHAVPVHHSPGDNRLLIGFVYRIDHPLLKAVEQVTGCRAAPCIITAAAWKQQFAAREAEGSIEFSQRAMQQSRITSLIVEHAIENRADTVRMGLSSSAIWARLGGESHACDLVIEFEGGTAAAAEEPMQERVARSRAAIRA